MFAAFGAAGCKNVCEKAADHMKACAEQFCEENADSPICEAMQDESDEAIPECTEEAQAFAQELLDKECSEIFGTGE